MFFWVLPVLTGFYVVVLGLTWFYLALLCFIRFLPSLTEFVRFMFGWNGIEGTASSSSRGGFYRVLHH